MVSYDPQKIEKKWQQKWEESNIFTVKEDLKKYIYSKRGSEKKEE